MRIPLRPPGSDERSGSPAQCQEWAAKWTAYIGPGYLEHTDLTFSTGIHPMPKTLVLERPGDVARVHADDLETWLRCGKRLAELQKSFPRANFHSHVRAITQLAADDYACLHRAVTWLTVNPSSGLFLRQLPIEGVHTKWLAAYSTLVLALLGDDVAEQSPDARERSLHERLGLRTIPELVQVTLLDPALRAQFAGMRTFAATIDDLNRWREQPSQVLILNNRETAFAITNNHKRTAVLYGHDFHAGPYARINWVWTAERIVYWGDIDTASLQFVSDLRALGIPVRTVLTDTGTLHRYRRLAVEGELPRRNTAPPHITDAERELYERLAAYSAEHGTGLLLEQERLPWQEVYPTLTSSLVCRGDDVSGLPASRL